MSEKYRILVVDDERIVRVTTTKQLVAAGYHAESAAEAETAWERIQEGRWNVILTDLRMPGLDGISFLNRIKESYPGVEVVLMTAFGTVENAVTAMKGGAADFLTKPFHFDELQMRLEKLHHRMRTERELEALKDILDASGDDFGLIGHSPGIQTVRERIRAFASNGAPLLITGETGTGKEVVARAISRASTERKGEFVPVGCGTIPKELAESELFGHEKGAFTGASQMRRGSFERANGGTLLLDDVDDLPVDIQVKLLRVLQEGTLTRVGSSGMVAADVRVIATSKVDLEDAVKQGNFRPDLFYRLRGLEIRLPPLRDRGEDILLLANHFLHLIAAEHGDDPKRLSADSGRVLEHYPWPGNVRELRRAMESAAVLAPKDVIFPADLPEFLLRIDASAPPYVLHLESVDAVPLTDLVGAFEREILQWALEKSRGNQSMAARLVGLPRTTFQSKLRDLDLA